MNLRTSTIGGLVAVALVSVGIGALAVDHAIPMLALVSLPSVVLIVARPGAALLVAVAVSIVVPHYVAHAWLVPPMLGAAALVAQVNAGQRLRRTDVLFAIWLAWVAASWRLHPELNGVTVRMFFDGFLPMLFYVWARMAVNTQSINRVLWVLLISGTMGALTVDYEWLHGSVVFNDPTQYQWSGSQGIFRPGGVFGGAPTASISLSMISLAALPLLRERRRVTSICLAVILLAVAVTFTRAGWIGLAAGSITVAGLAPYRRFGKVVYVFVVGVVLFLAFQSTLTQSRVFNLGIERSATLADRTTLLHMATPLFADTTSHLLVGRGFYSLHNDGWHDPHVLEQAPLLLRLGGPHNDYLRAVLEQGLVGALLLIAWLGSALGSGFRAARRLKPGSTDRLVIAGLTGGVVAYATSGLFHDVSHAVPNLSLGALLVGLLVSVALTHRSTGSTPDTAKVDR